MKRTLMIYTITFSAVAAILVGGSTLTRNTSTTRVAEGESCVTEAGGSGLMMSTGGGEEVCVADAVVRG